MWKFKIKNVLVTCNANCCLYLYIIWSKHEEEPQDFSLRIHWLSWNFEVIHCLIILGEEPFKRVWNNLRIPRHLINMGLCTHNVSEIVSLSYAMISQTSHLWSSLSNQIAPSVLVTSFFVDGKPVRYPCHIVGFQKATKYIHIWHIFLGSLTSPVIQGQPYQLVLLVL